jgi:hypothetical protein
MSPEHNLQFVDMRKREPNFTTTHTNTTNETNSQIQRMTVVQKRQIIHHNSVEEAQNLKQPKEQLSLL